MTSPRFVAEPSPADVAAVRTLSPLAADLTMRCGPFEVPVAVVASTPRLETEVSEEARVTRQFIADDPWAGMGSVHAGGWVLLARDEDTIVIGQREDAVGLGKVAVLVRHNGAFEAQSLGGWQLCVPDRSEQVEASFTAVVHQATVTVEWDCGRDLTGVPDRVVSRCEVLETANEVHFLLMSIRNPAKPVSVSGAEVGTGASATATFELSRPLGPRTMFNDFRIPAHPVTIAPT